MSGPRLVLFAVLFGLIALSGLSAQSDDGQPSLWSDSFSALVQIYRDQSGENSVHRCQFDVSCSHFAERAIQKNGPLFGLVQFIDRYFYRENTDVRNHYPLVEEPDGTYRVSDAPFLP